MGSNFTVNDLDVQAFSDGTMPTPLSVVLGMDRAEVESLAGGPDDVTVPVHNYLFRKNGKTFLIDAGSGPARRKTLGKLRENLLSAGVDPGDIDYILLTHLHPDHADGLIGLDGEATFPNAEVVLHEVEHNFWMGGDNANESDKLKATRVRNKLNMRPYAQRTRLMREGEDLFGCTPIMAAGHSPGHICWRVMAGRDSFVAWGDLVHLSDVQISHPEAALTFDIDKQAASKSRVRILDMMANERALVAGAHIQGNGYGYITRRNGSFAFDMC